MHGTTRPWEPSLRSGSGMVSLKSGCGKGAEKRRVIAERDPPRRHRRGQEPGPTNISAASIWKQHRCDPTTRLPFNDGLLRLRRDDPTVGPVSRIDTCRARHYHFPSSPRCVVSAPLPTARTPCGASRGLHLLVLQATASLTFHRGRVPRRLATFDGRAPACDAADAAPRAPHHCGGRTGVGQGAHVAASKV
jgi:hypothetical protein